LIYLSSPGYMADYAGRMVEAGARLLDGCCGTTPGHIAAMREVLDRRLPAARPRRGATRPLVARPAPVAETPGLLTVRPPTLLQRNLEAVDFVVTVELDPPRAGDYTNATAVFDVDGVGLIEVLRRMNEGVDATGNSIGEPTSFCVGAALNPAAEDVDREIERFQRKIAAGARWVQTQPVYDLAQLERFLERAGGSPVPLLVGLLPLHSF